MRKSVVAVLAIALAFGFFVLTAEALVTITISTEPSTNILGQVGSSTVLATFAPSVSSLGGILERASTTAYYAVGVSSTASSTGVHWRIHVAHATSSLSSGMVSISEVGWYDLYEGTVATEVYTFGAATTTGTLVANGGIWDVETSDQFVNVDSIAFSGSAPTGAYTITRQLIDSLDEVISNNYSFIVTVTDTDPPILTSRTIVSSNVNSSSLAKVGDTVTVSFTADEPLQTPTVTIAGNAAVVSDGPTAWTAAYVMQQSDMTQGDVSFSINYMDLSSNAGVAVSTTTDASTVTFDSIAPIVIETGSITTPTNDNTPNYTFTTTEAGSLQYSGGCASASTTAAVGSNVITFNTLLDGTYSACTVKVTDVTGNQSTSTNVTSFTVDTVGPSATITSSASPGPTNDPIPVTVTFNEGVTGFTDTDVTVGNGTVGLFAGAGTTYTFTVTPTVTSGTVTVDVAGGVAQDTALNFNATSTQFSIVFDSVAPTVLSITTKDADGDGRVDTATVVFSEPVDDSTFAASSFTIGGSAGTSFTAGTVDDNTLDVFVAGGVAGTNVKDVTYTAGLGADLAGNLLASVNSGAIIEVDAAKPVFMSARTQTTTTIDLTFSEDLNGASVTNADFTVAGGHTLTSPDAFETFATSGVVRITLTPSIGTGDIPDVTLAGSVIDLNANVSVGVTRTPADGVPPILTSVSIASNNASTSLAKEGDTVTVSFTSSETIQTPTVTIQGAVATSVTGTSTAWNASRVMTGADAEGNVAFTVNFSDTSANAGAQVSATTNGSAVLFDRTVPNVSAGVDVSAQFAVTLMGAASDSGSGVSSTVWSKTSGSGTITFTSPTSVHTTTTADTAGSYVLRLTATDNAGNVAFDEMEFAWIQPPPPGGGGGGGGGGGAIPATPATPATPAVPQISPAVPATPATPATPAQGAQVSGQVLGAASFTFPRNLGFGSRGDDVIALQQRLTTEGVYNGPITGFFGPLTRRAVIAFQAKYGIAQVGNIGPLTRARLNSSGQVAGVTTVDTQAAARAELERLQNLLNQLLEQLRQRSQ